MNIREYAESIGFEIVGKLTYKGKGKYNPVARWYLDEAGNEYFQGSNGEFCIIDKDGNVR